MRLGVTTRFQNSYFSGSIPQVACALSRALAYAGHDVTMLYPPGESDWFVDLQEHAVLCPRRKAWSCDQSYDILIEVAWSLSETDRTNVAPRVILFSHYPPIFYDMESSVYQWNPLIRNFKHITELWTYDFYSKQDVRYLEFLSGVPVQSVPYMWDHAPLDSFISKESIRTWDESAKALESMIAEKNTPKSLSWSARIVESNFSNSSSCILPLNILSEIRKNGDPIRFTVHNGESVGKHPFFNTNVSKNLVLPDISGNMMARVRLPELRKDKSIFLCHQRFRPLKSYMLDALYLGIPMIHNCDIVRSLGAPYYYELNQIQDAVAAWKKLENDYEMSEGFFNSKQRAIRESVLKHKFSPESLSAQYDSFIKHAPPTIPVSVPVSAQKKVLRIAFAKMWDDFQPKYNFFTYLLSWFGSMNNIRVEIDTVAPNIVFFGPLSEGSEKQWPGVPKLFFTGENSRPNKDPDTFLNIGFEYTATPNYIRLPLWVLEINWWGANVEKIVNPKPVPLSQAMNVDLTLLDRKKFCAFVATNPTNQNRNAAFHLLSQWKKVDSGGRLFCNLPGGPIPAGRGGGGGELSKINFYKDYKFVLTFENSSGPGYVTEKLFHAKIAGAVPIYWGDPFVERDFDGKGFINVNQVSSGEELVRIVKKIDDSDELWRAMASIPALSESKRHWCEQTIEHIAKIIFKQVFRQSFSIPENAWSHAHSFGEKYESDAITMGSNQSATVTPVAPTSVAPASAVPTPVAPAPITEVATVAPAPITEVTPAAPTSVAPAIATPITFIHNLDKLHSQNAPNNRILVTAFNMKYAESGINLASSMRRFDKGCKIIVYVWPNVTNEIRIVLQKQGVSEIRELPINDASQTPWADYWEPQYFAWKLWILNEISKTEKSNSSVMYMDAGIFIAHDPSIFWKITDEYGICLFDDEEQKNIRWCQPSFNKLLDVQANELQTNQIVAGCIGWRIGHSFASNIIPVAFEYSKIRDAIVGPKLCKFSEECFGHRHDQSILSIVTLRAHAPRVPLYKFYTGHSLRYASQYNLPLYVHRGAFHQTKTFANNIDEVYVINLERREDRLQKFKANHYEIKNGVYVFPAIDGKNIKLTPELVHLFRNNDFGWKKAIMGCAMSHYTLWKKLADDTVMKTYLILEDDVKIKEGCWNQWNQMQQKMPVDADVIYLGGVLPPNKQGFQTIIEPVNDCFARVAPNTLFKPTHSRYFHFCNYSYILTKSGAKKLIKLIEEKGIFTSGDHMIVNHGDSLLNIYFTTPLVTGCFQDDDPTYQTSQFNNYNRIDSFDSDLWNNDERFTKEEIDQIMHSVEMKHTSVEIWNNFLKQLSLKNHDELRKSIADIFQIWQNSSMKELEQLSKFFNIFEQLLVQKNPVLIEHVQYIHECVEKTMRTNISFDEWGTRLLKSFVVTKASITLFHPDVIKPTFHEHDWLQEILGVNVSYESITTLQRLMEYKTPILIYQKNAGHDIAKFYTDIIHAFEAAGRSLILLHLSDEFSNDSIAMYGSSAVKHVIRNYWRSDIKQYGDKVYCIPLGYAAGRQHDKTRIQHPFEKRAHLWTFTGSLDRPGRSKALEILRTTGNYDECSKTSWDKPFIRDGPAYNESLENAKFVPCFCGSRALESFRLYEAIEHGAIPIYVPHESMHDEYKEMFEPNPLLGFPSWEKAAEILPKMGEKTEFMEKQRIQLQAWWAAKKHEIRLKLQTIITPL